MAIAKCSAALGHEALKSNQCYFERHDECWMSRLCECKCHQRLATLLILLTLLLTGAARAQSLVLPLSSYHLWNVVGSDVNTLPNGEQWLILHNQNGLGIQVQSEMPVATTFTTNVVVNRDDRGSVQFSIAGDCQAKTYEIMSTQSYHEAYRSGLPLGAPVSGDGVIRHVEPEQDTEMVWVFATACAASSTGGSQ